MDGSTLPGFGGLNCDLERLLNAKVDVVSCRGLSDNFRECQPEDIWSSAINFRKVLVQQYFGIDIEAVWQVVARDLPALGDLVDRILASEL